MSLPKSVDLRPRFAKRGLLEPAAQGRRGTCSLFALVSVLEFESAGNARGERLSVEFLNWASHQTNGRKADGSFFSDALEGLRRFGVCGDTLLPYSPDFDPTLQPPPAAREDALRRRRRRSAVSARWLKEWDVRTGLSDAQMTAVRTVLAEGHPVACGLRWPKQERYGPGQVLETPPPTEVFDGHSIVLVGYTSNAHREGNDEGDGGGGTFLFRNASGPEWADRGYARFTYAYARAYANDAVALTVAGNR